MRTLLTAVVLAASLTACSGDHPGAAARSTASAAPPATSTSPSTGPTADPDPCTLGQLSAVRLPGDPAVGAVADGGWAVSFAVVDRAAGCTLDRRIWFTHTGYQGERLPADVVLGAGQYVVLRLAFASGARPCEIAPSPVTPVLLGQREDWSAEATAVAGVAVPESALACGRRSLRLAVPSQLAPAALLAQVASRPTPTADLLPGLVTVPRHGDDLTRLARGAPLPLFCGLSTRGYEFGLRTRSTVLTSGTDVEEDRQLDRFRGAAAARSAYDELLGQARRCTWDPPDVSVVGPGRLGRDSFTVDYDTAGTGAGHTYQRWVVVRVGARVLVAVTTQDLRRPPFPDVTTVVDRLLAAS